MNDLNGTALAALAAALAPHIATELAKLNTGGGGVQTQTGGGFGAAQNTGAQFAGQAGNTQGAQIGGNVQQGGAAVGGANMFGGGAVQQAQPTVTPDMIQQLITPLVQNEQVKQALTAAMQSMGINNLPDARPDQMAELYTKFQTIDQQARQAGLIGGAAQGTPSII